jgi:hypothetical protein
MIDHAVLVVAWAGRVVRKAATTLARVETALVAARDAGEPEWRVADVDDLSQTEAWPLIERGAAWDARPCVGCGNATMHLGARCYRCSQGAAS